MHTVASFSPTSTTSTAPTLSFSPCGSPCGSAQASPYAMYGTPASLLPSPYSVCPSVEEPEPEVPHLAKDLFGALQAVETCAKKMSVVSPKPLRLKSVEAEALKPKPEAAEELDSVSSEQEIRQQAALLREERDKLQTQLLHMAEELEELRAQSSRRGWIDSEAMAKLSAAKSVSRSAVDWIKENGGTKRQPTAWSGSPDSAPGSPARRSGSPSPARELPSVSSRSHRASGSSSPRSPAASDRSPTQSDTDLVGWEKVERNRANRVPPVSDWEKTGYSPTNSPRKSPRKSPEPRSAQDLEEQSPGSPSSSESSPRRRLRRGPSVHFSRKVETFR